MPNCDVATLKNASDALKAADVEVNGSVLLLHHLLQVFVVAISGISGGVVGTNYKNLEAIASVRVVTGNSTQRSLERLRHRHTAHLELYTLLSASDTLYAQPHLAHGLLRL